MYLRIKLSVWNEVSFFLNHKYKNIFLWLLVQQQDEKKTLLLVPSISIEFSVLYGIRWNEIFLS